MRFKRFLAGSVALILLATLASCVQKPEEETDEPRMGKEDFSVSAEPDENAKALATRHEEYLENSNLAFSQNQPADGALFETEARDGGVAVTAYTGSDPVVVIPEKIGGKTVVALGEQAFSGSTVRAVSVPDSVEQIGKGAFADCNNLSSLRLPFVGDGGEITHFGHIFGTDSYENQAVTVPTSLDMVILGEKTREISDNAFAHCKTLSAVVVTRELEQIGAFAFYECRDLVYFDVRNQVKRIGEYAFAYCGSLFAPSFGQVERIGVGAFYECNGMRAITLPFVGESREENRFFGHIFGAESADFNDEFVPKSLYVVVLGHCEEIPDRAFAGCLYIGKLVIGNGIQRIGVRAFYGCRSLTEISLPDEVTHLGDDAFFGCDNLAFVEFGKGLETIGMQAFYGCKALKTVRIPEKVTEIKPSTFALCSSLELVELNQVKKIGKDAFSGCELLSPVDLTGIEVAEGNEALSGVSEARD